VLPGTRTPRSFLPARASRGVLAGLRHFLRVVVLTTVYRRMLVFSYELEGRTIPVRNPPAGCRFARLGEDEIARYLVLRPDQDASGIRRRMAAGQTCHVCWRDGAIIDAGWSATGRVHVEYLGRDLVPGKGEVYEHDAFTSPAARGRGLYMAHNSYVAREQQRDGRVRSIALVAVENEAAVKTLTRAGLRIDGCVHRLGVGRAALTWSRPLPGRTLPRLAAPERSAAGSLHARAEGRA
jgi:hypothetical protein